MLGGLEGALQGNVLAIAELARGVKLLQGAGLIGLITLNDVLERLLQSNDPAPLN
jgi:hypothetical protein